VSPDDLPDAPLLVDASVASVTFLRSGRYAQFKPFLDRALANGRQLLISFATLGELRAWPLKTGWEPARVARLELAIRSYLVLPYDDQVTELYAPLQARLGDQLKKYGRNDMWTAACALSHPELPPILTDDLADYQKIQAIAPTLRLAHPDL
jgi:predicted nucleic acid-binding protein